MAMTPEAKAKKKVKQLLADYGVWYCSPMGSGFGNSGVPDLIGCSKGRFFAIEVKANTEVTKLQQMNLDMIAAQGGFAIVVRINDRVIEGMGMLENFLKGE